MSALQLEDLPWSGAAAEECATLRLQQQEKLAEAEKAKEERRQVEEELVCQRQLQAEMVKKLREERIVEKRMVFLSFAVI